MSKHHEPGSFSDTQITTLHEMEEFAQSEVDQKYGVGYPTYRGGNNLWFYHNGLHTEMVRDDSDNTSVAVGLTRGARAIVRFAAAEHDNDQGKGHEERNAKSAIERLRQQGFSEAIVTMAGLAITGTRVIMKNGILVGQEATRQKYPSREAEEIALSVACGDLGVIWKPTGPLQMHNLYREMHKRKAPPLDNDFIQYLEDQRQMVDGYRYPLAAARPVLATHYDQVMQYYDHVHGQLERGELSEWNQLERQDILFSRYPDDWYTRM